MPRTIIVTFKVPIELVQKLDELVARGVFSSRSEALRRALVLLLAKYEAENIEAYDRGDRDSEEAEKNIIGANS